MAQRTFRLRNVFRNVQYISSAALILILVTVLMTILSLAYDRVHKGEHLWLLAAANLRHHPDALILFFLGVIIGTLGCMVALQKGFRELTNHLWVPLKEPGFYILVVIALAVAVLFFVLSAELTTPLHPDATGFLGVLQHDPGGLFAIFMGLLTVVGFALTLQSLAEIRRTITSFSDLIFRLNRMLSRAQEGEVVRMLCYTPSLGYIALDDREFSSFSAKLKEPLPNDRPRAEMICLNKQALEDWHRLFVGRRTRRKNVDRVDDHPVGSSGIKTLGQVSGAVAAAATDRGNGIVKALRDRAEDPEGAVKRLPLEFMPGYYFFFSEDRAIVVAPLYLPFGKGAPKSIQKGLPPVADMIGFETNDRGMIGDLRLLYDVYHHLPSTYVAEVREPVKGSDYEQWIRSDRIKEIMENLLVQFNVARGKTPIGQTTNDDDKERAQYYGEYLRDEKWLPNTKLEVLFRVMLVEEDPDRRESSPNG